MYCPRRVSQVLVCLTHGFPAWLQQSSALRGHGSCVVGKDHKHRIERQYGSFTRSFTLPSSVDQGPVSAHYDKGVLKIKLAKKVNVGSEKTLEAKVHGKA
jgi:HSP20 family protein